MPIGHGILFKPADIHSQEQIRNNIRPLAMLVHKEKLRKLKGGNRKKMKKTQWIIIKSHETALESI